MVFQAWEQGNLNKAALLRQRKTWSSLTINRATTYHRDDTSQYSSASQLLVFPSPHVDQKQQLGTSRFYVRARLNLKKCIVQLIKQYLRFQRKEGNTQTRRRKASKWRNHVVISSSIIGMGIHQVRMGGGAVSQISVKLHQNRALP